MQEDREQSCEPILDPRIRRTRMSLQHALCSLLATKEFEKISVQDIAEAAAVNRATFYDHYPDKFALLECMVGARFAELLSARGIHFNAGCPMALRGIVTGVCDYLATAPGAECTRQLPHMEAAVIAVVRKMLMDGLNRHPQEHRAALEQGIPPAIIVGTAAWAIYGAAKEWIRNPKRRAVEVVVEDVVRLVGPMLGVAAAQDAVHS